VQRALYISHLILNSPIHGTRATLLSMSSILSLSTIDAPFLRWILYEPLLNSGVYSVPSSSIRDDVRTSGHVSHPKLLNGFRVHMTCRTHIKTINTHAVKICIFNWNRFWITFLIRTHRTDKIVQCAKEYVQRS
jgi:hypothetical protein